MWVVPDTLPEGVHILDHVAQLPQSVVFGRLIQVAQSAAVQDRLTQGHVAGVGWSLSVGGVRPNGEVIGDVRRVFKSLKVCQLLQQALDPAVVRTVTVGAHISTVGKLDPDDQSAHWQESAPFRLIIPLYLHATLGGI